MASTLDLQRSIEAINIPIELEGMKPVNTTIISPRNAKNTSTKRAK